MNRNHFSLSKDFIQQRQEYFNILSAFFNLMHTRLLSLKNDTSKKSFVDIMKACENEHDEVE